ncbi:MAG: ribonuclease HII [Marinilabiliales bacterium]|nr:MAG: ribonuclease HII [Marinilabiliales bacterium]
MYNYDFEAGCDEAGRGCLAGPVVAAAVILPKNYTHADLNDSKKLSEKQRNNLRAIIEKDAIAYAVEHFTNHEIDKYNILKSSILAMHKALDSLNSKINHIIVDGNKFLQYKDIPHSCVIKGDGKFLSIAAASILAKTYRDEYMMKLHDKYPEYNWKKNKGYPTKEHRKAISIHGIKDFHRKSFNLFDKQLSLDL